MKIRSAACITLLAVNFAAPALMAQSQPLEPAPCITLRVPPINPLDVSTAPPPPAPTKILLHRISSSGVNVSKTPFLLLSAGVYGAATADMYQTMQVRHFYWWHETDPFARPLVHLPTPAYYATGLALATGLNWFSWKMAHSRRFHKLAPIPQLAAIAGNLRGLDTNIH
jgi:hypothetical protein